MRFKRLLALLLAAALALSLLAGCGGGKNQSLSQMLLNLLDGQYQNVSVEIDSDLEAKLRQAISQSETDEELRAALEQLLGGGISFQRLGSGQQGDSAWTLIIYPGTDPDAAARSVYLDLDKVFAALPDDGVYSSGFAMAEMENGYAILVKATVDKAGTEDKPDPVTLESIKVTKNPKLEYWVGESFNPAGMEITATYSNNTTKTLKDIKKNGDQGVKWTPETFDSDGTKTVTISYGEKNTTVSVTVKEPEVEKIEVTKQPNQIEYNIGASFNPTGMVITATYSDNVKQETIDSNYKNKGVTWEPETIEANTTQVIISYKGKTATVPITVTQPALTGITVTGPNKTTYEIGETFDPTGMVVTAYYSNGSNTIINNYTITDKDGQTVGSSYTFTTAGSYTLTVTYTEGAITKTDTITITVVDKGYTDDGKGNYTVTTAHGLESVAELVNSGETGINITLDNNIDLTGEWTPIGTYDKPYTGTFDGDNHTISGLIVTGSDEYAGLFGYIGSGGTVKNVKLENVQITSDYQYAYVGGVAGNNDGAIENCSVSGSVSGNSTYNSVGGVVGYQGGGSITGCSSSATVQGTGSVGGVVGQTNSGAILTACYATGKVTLESNNSDNHYAGGVVGVNGASSTLTACYATGSVTGSGGGTIYAGGVTGTNDFGTLTACYHANGTVSGRDGATTGGVAGRNYKGFMSYGGIITACYWSGYNGNGIGYDETNNYTSGSEYFGSHNNMVTGGDWSNAYNAMNTALDGTSCPWRYSSTGTLIKQ